MSYDGVIAVIILAVVGTSFAVLLFNRLIKISNPVFASSVTYFIPIIAVIFGIMYNEEITLIQIFGLIIILIGVLILNMENPMSKLKGLTKFAKTSSL